MPRAIQPATEAINPDSFLDIVASVVSIMIIMVLMTGMKIKRSPVPVAPASEALQIGDDLTRDLATEQSLQQDVLRMAAEIQQLQQETAIRKQDRDVLALVVRSLEERTGAPDQQPDVESPGDSALGRALCEARVQLEESERLRMAIETTPAAPIQIESYPTPLSRPVAGRELHFQLCWGRLAFIPLETLVERFKSDAEHKAYRLRDLPEFTETVGPEGGFRLRYTLERREIAPEGAGRAGRGGAIIRLRRWTLIPISDSLGETLDEALKEGSQFRQVLADRRVRGATVTIWIYPDSFDAFRQIKKELYRVGFPVAGRPLPEGTPISGSPDGSKSNAE